MQKQVVKPADNKNENTSSLLPNKIFGAPTLTAEMKQKLAEAKNKRSEQESKTHGCCGCGC